MQNPQLSLCIRLNRNIRVRITEMIDNQIKKCAGFIFLKIGGGATAATLDIFSFLVQVSKEIRIRGTSRTWVCILANNPYDSSIDNPKNPLKYAKYHRKTRIFSPKIPLTIIPGRKRCSRWES